MPNCESSQTLAKYLVCCSRYRFVDFFLVGIAVKLHDLNWRFLYFLAGPSDSNDPYSSSIYTDLPVLALLICEGVNSALRAWQALCHNPEAFKVLGLHDHNTGVLKHNAHRHVC